MAVSMLFVVIATLSLVQFLESRHLSDIFVDYQLDMHEKIAQEQLYRLVDLLREQKNSVKALVTQKNFIDHLELHEKNGWPEKTLFYNSPPEWFPLKSIIRAFYHNTYALLIDPQGTVREVYQDIEKPLSPQLLHPELLLPRLINMDSIITYMGDEPFQLVIQRIYSPAKQLRATLMFAFPIDTYFIRRSQGAILSNTELALLDCNNKVIASSNTDVIPIGTMSDMLDGKYYFSKKTFLEYGESEIELMFVSLIPKTTIELLTKNVLLLQLEYGLKYGFAFILSSTLAVFLLSGKIRDLTKETVDFIRNNLGKQYKAPSVGDELSTLETSFHQMKKEIIINQNLLAEEKERLAVTLGSIGDAVIATDTNGIILLINNVAEDLTGWSQQDAIGRPLSEVFYIINEKTRMRCEDPFEKVLSTGLTIGLANHAALISRDGTERVIADSGAPIRDNENRMIGIVIVFRDITGKRKIEEQLFNAKKLESIATLAAGIAHEINNPLTNASLNLEVMKVRMQNSNIDRKILHKLDSVERNVNRASVIARELLDFSRHKESILVSVNIISIIKDVVSLVEYKLNNIIIHQDLPEVPDIIGDPAKLEQVFINIMNNSFEAMPHGGDIFISTSQENGNVKIEITDTGEGIPAEIISKVFDPFFTTKDVGVGTGLGLAICYGIIKMHNGSINLQSKHGQGTLVTVRIPEFNV